MQNFQEPTLCREKRAIMQQIMQFLQSSTWNTIILFTSMLKISETLHDVSKVCYFVQIMVCPLIFPTNHKSRELPRVAQQQVFFKFLHKQRAKKFVSDSPS